MVLHSRGCGRVARRRILSSDLLVESLTGFPEGPFRIPLGVPVGRSAQGTPFLYPNGCFPPPIGGFWTPEGPWAEGFLHPLGVLFRREARGREDRSSHWESRDAGGSQEFQGSFLPLSDGGIDWGTMHYFVPKRCVESNKIMYRDKATARQAADQSWRERGTELWVYRCEFCGTWHLTHRDPQSSYTYVPFNQQIKPHSRKKGYKPRRK